MKFDKDGCLVREKYSPGSPGNCGDSCAETSRASILKHPADYRGLMFFIESDKGYLRHPSLFSMWGGITDFSNDQFIALLMAMDIYYQSSARSMRSRNRWKILGTKTWLSVGSWALVCEWYWLLNAANIVQGWLLGLSFRWSDDGDIEKSEGQVQDWLNFIVIYVYLKRRGKWATLNRSVADCLRAVHTYYLEGKDAEPNSQWLFELYQNELEKT